MEELIRRNDAIKALEWEEAVTKPKLSDIRYRIKNIPAVKPCDLALCERENGEWLEKEVVEPIDVFNPIEVWQSARCSVCGKYHTTPYMYYFTEYEFCPSCGAMMEMKPLRKEQKE